MSEVTYHVAFVAADDGIAAGEAVEGFNPIAAVRERRGRSPTAAGGIPR
jgi:hypothetical protein